MTTISNNEIARAIFLATKDKHEPERSHIYKNVVKFLSRKRLFSKVPDILLQLEKKINFENGRIVVKVKSDESLKEAIKSELAHVIKKRYSAKEIILIETLDKSLLGGLRLEINDEVIDLSIKNKIGKLNEYLTRPA